MSREIILNKDKKTEVHSSTSTDRDLSALEVDEPRVHTEHNISPKSVPSAASVRSKAASVSTGVVETMSALMTETMNRIERAQKIQAEALERVMKNAQEIQADTLLRVFSQQKNSAPTSTPMWRDTASAAANSHTSVISLPANVFNASNSDASQCARSLPPDGENKTEKLVPLDA
ncbi:unnamed protein product [Didymodactylos carnosus]|uniref:Uncharacterized protein n=2 Tax=Didymodactylos carnosus TaxID=1234261 RepID=A0A8S2QNU3_9BILA|nr:unnamed protein product [Didymodactylos carnosus]CAF4109542.1 unnamed protein product [Didymodactylos carnosus]